MTTSSTQDIKALSLRQVVALFALSGVASESSGAKALLESTFDVPALLQALDERLIQADLTDEGLVLALFDYAKAVLPEFVRA
jgi:hypothetical protein